MHVVLAVLHFVFTVGRLPRQLQFVLLFSLLIRLVSCFSDKAVKVADCATLQDYKTTDST